MRHDGGATPIVAAYVIDSRASSGLGHLIRSVALAHAVAGHAVRTSLFLHGGPPMLAGVGLREEWEVHHTDAPAEDVAAWSRRAEGASKILVVDDPRATLAREQTVHGIQVIATFVDGRLPVGTFDVMINGTAYAGEIGLSVPAGTVTCFGLEYACLRPEFHDFRRERPETRSTARRILVSLGGADPRALTPAVNDLAARVLASLTRDAMIDVVIGPGSAIDDRALGGIQDRAGVRTVVHRGSGNLAPLMASADVAVSAGGGTLYELAFLGVPTISLPQTPDEERNAGAVARAGACIAISPQAGWESELAASLGSLVADPRRRNALSVAASRLVDGRGPERIAEVLSSCARRRAA